MNEPISNLETLESIEKVAKKEVKLDAKLAWEEFLKPNKELVKECCNHIEKMAISSQFKNDLVSIISLFKII